MLRRWVRSLIGEASPDGEPGAEAGAAPGEPGAPDTLGGWLREQRLQSGFTLEQVAEETRISRGYLEAIEANRFDVLPAPVYVRGFVRLYARFLAIDPEDAVERLPEDLPTPPGLEPLPGLRLREGAGVLPRVGRRWLVLAVLAAVVLAAAFLFGFPDLGLGGADGEPDATANGGATATPEATAAPSLDRVPDLSGLARAEAEQRLRDLGVTFVVLEVANAEAPAGQVFAQSPNPGETLVSGQTVTLIVAKQPAAADE